MTTKEIYDRVKESISVVRVDIDYLINATLNDKQDWYDSCTESGLRIAYDADDTTTKRWMVDYILHNLIEYDARDFYRFRNNKIKELSHDLNIDVIKKISEIYPELKAECDRRVSRLIVNWA